MIKAKDKTRFIPLLLFGLIHGFTLRAGEAAWIFFRDKGGAEIGKTSGAFQPDLTLRSLERRGRVLPKSRLTDETDWPVSPAYISQVEATGARVRIASRWLNAVSAVLTPSQEDAVQALPFVKRIRSVAVSGLDPPPHSQPAYPGAKESGSGHVNDYGISRTQNEMMRVPDVHDLGLTGRGVLIGMLDTGFDFRDRKVFARLDVIAEHDFIWEDDITANQDEDPARQDDHGTETLSVIAGYLAGSLVGPAFGAQYALAKTEWMDSETRIEEDYWVAGLEWLEAQGADIVSSSVAYSDFDEGFSYTYQDLDGATCVTTVAAEIAYRKGVIVVNSAGNERNNEWHYIMSPADGPHVLGVGAVDLTGDITYFSSVGPTADGRIKPDVVAMGMGVVAVNPNRDSEHDFYYVSGTSFSCPLVAGVCALILEGHPELTSLEVQKALRMTAGQAADPDTLYGWGIVNAWEALFHYGMVFHRFKWLTDLQTGCPVLEVTVQSRNGVDPGSVCMHFRDSESEPFQRIVMEHVRDSSRFSALLPRGIREDSLRFYLQASDPDGGISTGPYDAPARLYSLSDTTGKDIHVPEDIPDAFRLYPAYPNPFNDRVHIEFDLNTPGFVRLDIYNIRGQRVRTLVSAYLDAGSKRILWDATEGRDRPAASGLYLARLEAGSQSGVIKMSLIR